jgi:P27 family predicted phage terminase small subunit
MGLRGPRPQPTAIKVMRGTFRADRANVGEPPALPVSSLAAPSWLDGEGRKVWRRLVRHCDRLKVLSDSDLPLLSLLCDQWAVYLEASAFLREHGSVYSLRDADGNVKAVMPFPQVSIRNRAAEHVRRLSAEFGLSPSARSRVNGRAEDGPVDELAAFLEGAGA